MVVDLRRLRKQQGSAAAAGSARAKPMVSGGAKTRADPRLPIEPAAPAAPLSAPTRRIEHPPGGVSRGPGPSEVVISKTQLRLLWGFVVVSLAAALALAFARFG